MLCTFVYQSADNEIARYNNLCIYETYFEHDTERLASLLDAPTKGYTVEYTNGTMCTHTSKSEEHDIVLDMQSLSDDISSGLNCSAVIKPSGKYTLYTTTAHTCTQDVFRFDVPVNTANNYITLFFPPGGDCSLELKIGYVSYCTIARRTIVVRSHRSMWSCVIIPSEIYWYRFLPARCSFNVICGFAEVTGFNKILSRSDINTISWRVDSDTDDDTSADYLDSNIIRLTGR